MEGNTQKLDVPRILLSAVLAPIVHWKLVGWYAIPLIVVELVRVVFERSLVDLSAGVLLGGLVLGLASGLAWLLLAVACHRIFILGDASMDGRMFLRWAPRETRFLGWTIMLGLVSAALIIPLLLIVLIAGVEYQALDGVINFILALPVLYVVTRLSLILPATAIDRTSDLQRAWKASRKNGIRLLLAVSLLPMLLQAPPNYLQNTLSLVYQAALSLVEIYAVIVGIAALSFSYRELARNMPGISSEATTR